MLVRLRHYRRCERLSISTELGALKRLARLRFHLSTRLLTSAGLTQSRGRKAFGGSGGIRVAKRLGSQLCDFRGGSISVLTHGLKSQQRVDLSDQRGATEQETIDDGFAVWLNASPLG